MLLQNCVSYSVWIHLAQDGIGAHYLTGEGSRSVKVREFLTNDCEVLNKDCTMQLITCVSEIIHLRIHSYCNSLWAYIKSCHFTSCSSGARK